jgi:LacI family transcriptional regulator
VIELKVTIKDIARMADVSISTVSRVVNNSKPVNEEVRKRVVDAMKQTNYRPGIVAGEDGKPDTCLIGVILPQNSNTVLHDFIAGIKNVAQLYDYDVIIGLTEGARESELHYLNVIRKNPVQGIIFVGSVFDQSHYELLEETNTPCVLVGEISQIPEVPSVHLDNVTASYEAVTYLIQKGHRDIAMIRGTGNFSVGGQRFQGYRQAMNDAGIPIREEWVVESEFSVEDGENAMRQIAENGSLPTAVFCATDWMAVGAMNYLMDNGLRVPEDVSVFGFDGSYISTVVRPRLSTVTYSGTEIGMTATRNLIKMIKGGTVETHHSNVTHFLEIRESTN